MEFMCYNNIRNNSIKRLRNIIHNCPIHIGVFSVSIPQGNYITRCREGKDLYKIEDFSYNPNKSIEYKRASTPYKNMFYGTLSDDDIIASRYVASSECCSLITDSTLDGEAYLSFGLWEIISPIQVAVIIPTILAGEENKLMCSFHERYMSYLQHIPNSKKMELTKFMDYMSDKFAQIGSPPLYKITGTFSEHIIGLGYEGILYLSVPTGGKYGMNIAIKPSVVDDKMKLCRVELCKMVKKDKNVTIKSVANGLICGSNIEYRYL